MFKKILKIDQIITTAFLLNFDKVNSVDISILTEEFLKQNPNYQVEDLDPKHLKRYIRLENGIISLKDEIDSYIIENKTTLKKKIVSAHIKKFIRNFDIEKFVLRKIEYYSPVFEDSINLFFCKTQIEQFKTIYEKGYITKTWNDDFISDHFIEINISIYGKIRIFKSDYAKELKKFGEQLKTLGYNPEFIDDFLSTQDLDLPGSFILKIENFIKFYENTLEKDSSYTYQKKIKN